MDIALLLSDAAQKFIRDHQDDDPVRLMLSNTGVKGVPLKDLVAQIKARHLVKSKIPSWFKNHRLVYGGFKSLEQSSSELTAAYKSQLVQGNHLVDLTGGLGVDSYFISKNFNRVTYVERHPGLCQLANHNFRELDSAHIEVVQGDANDILLALSSPVDCIYLDPDRRSTNQRTFRIEEGSPSVPSLLPVLWSKTGLIMLKLSPLQDIKAASMQLTNLKQVHVVSVKNECKELILVLDKCYQGDVQYFGVNFLSAGAQVVSCYQRENQAEPKYSNPMDYLYEPNSSIMKLGIFKWVCSSFGLCKLHPNSHLYTSNRFISDFPGRSFKVQWIEKYKPAKLRKLLPTMKANITTRNFIKDVKAIRKETGIKEGGTQYLFATTNPENSLIMINATQL